MNCSLRCCQTNLYLFTFNGEMIKVTWAKPSSLVDSRKDVYTTFCSPSWLPHMQLIFLKRRTETRNWWNILPLQWTHSAYFRTKIPPNKIILSNRTTSFHHIQENIWKTQRRIVKVCLKRILRFFRGRFYISLRAYEERDRFGKTGTFWRSLGKWGLAVALQTPTVRGGNCVTGPGCFHDENKPLQMNIETEKKLSYRVPLIITMH